VKPTAATAERVADLPTAAPYPGAKRQPVLDEWLDDAERMAELVRDTAAALPLPKPKTPRAR
jgi:hypothetical protein